MAAAAADVRVRPSLPLPPPPPLRRQAHHPGPRSRMQPPRVAPPTISDSTKFFPGFPAELFAENKAKMAGALR